MKWYENTDNKNDVVVSSRVRFARNLSEFSFPSRLDETSSKRVALCIRQALEKNDENKLTYTEMSGNRDKNLLVEEHIISPDFAAETNIYRSLITNEDKSLAVMINEEDHVRIQAILSGLRLDEAYDMANKTDDILIASAPVAFDENIGFLTACPTNLGTGMRASVMLHLPALSAFGHIKSIVNLMNKIGLTIRGIYGEGSEAVGCMYQLSNQVTLGLSEEDIISKLKSATNQIAERERELRKKLLEEQDSDVYDKLYRSLGTLKYARRISTDEASKLISNVLLASNCGLMPEIKDKNLIKLLFEIMPYHIVDRFPDAATSEGRDKYRADIIREYLN